MKDYVGQAFRWKQDFAIKRMRRNTINRSDSNTDKQILQA